MKSGYICEQCKSFHATPQAALDCETQHVPIAHAEIIAGRYDTPQANGHGFEIGKYPKRIEVRFGDWVQMYDFVRGYRSVREQPVIHQNP